MLYCQLIGSLMYLVNTRPDICFAVNTLSLCWSLGECTGWLQSMFFGTCKGLVDYGLDYRQGDGVRLASYIDSDWAGCASDRKNTSGCCFGLGSAIVSWFN